MILKTRTTKAQSYIFKSFSYTNAIATATATSDATASASNKIRIINHFSETPRKTLEDNWHCKITAANEPVGVSQTTYGNTI